ncbi:thiol:disulfide interchange protein DsbD [Campylobacter hyointestinalis subsp. hyointestinalis]|uniref:Thiol:disulfide interchange protein DsbD n=1 Tax=Campylobacter hyointestinalis subsp. hyointestinalis TaxID=91352 RepID=A0A9W5ERH5_CAMHY|nr:protein-disulfide reductase DsbD [Campylobacter hyointestinalis]CUU77327.1 thiol:disulfide interchange protein DsbD [Campylobacter hyointestinalis subsp. hyointestinalis]
MYRFLVLLFLFFSFSFGVVLSVDDAFKINASSDKTQGINLNFKVDESVYLYKDKLKITVLGNDITEYLNLPNYEKYDDYEIYKGEFDLFVPFGLLSNFTTKNKLTLDLKYQGCAYSGFCYQPMEATYEVSNTGGELKISKIQRSETPVKVAVSNQDKIANSFANDGKLMTIITFFGYGLLLSLTPCVFPMIPIVSSIIIAKSGEKRSIKTGLWISFIYVLFMSLAYAIAGVLASVFGASVQGLLQIPAVIIGFSIIFVLLSLSMFGLYNIELPKKFQSYISSKSEKKGGILGVAIMGFLSALVVGPCVAAPLAGALLYIANSGDALLGGIALFVMSMGMGVPLLLVGIGSSRLLPKPGFWMDEIKRAFGFLMLGMAVWMLSRVIGDEISYFLYGVLGIFWAVGLGAFEPASTNGLKFIKAFGLFIFIVSLVLVVNFSVNKFAPNLINKNVAIKQDNIEFIKVSNLKELDNILASSDKPVMIDFWASWCVNCKELDEITFMDPKVLLRLKDFTLIKIDVTNGSPDDAALMKKYSVFGPPALIFYKNTKELKNKQIVGFIGANEFLEHIKDI